MNSEPRPTDYLESSVESAGDADTSHHGVSEPDRDASELLGTDGPVKAARADWLFCIKRRGSVMTKLMFVMVGIPLIALLYFVISNAFSARRPPQVVISLWLLFGCSFLYCCLMPSVLCRSLLSFRKRIWPVEIE